MLLTLRHVLLYKIWTIDSISIIQFATYFSFSKPFRPLNSLTPDQWKSSLQEKNFDEVVNLSVGVLSLLHAALEEKDNMKNDLEILQGKFNEVKDINNNYLQFQKTDKGSQTERDDANVGSVTPVQELFKLDNHAAIPNNGLPLLYLENTTSSMVNPVTLNGLVNSIIFTILAIPARFYRIATLKWVI